MTTSEAQTVIIDIPENVTANECMTLSECSLRKVWMRPNLRTRITMFLSRLGIGVRRFDSMDALFEDLAP